MTEPATEDFTAHRNRAIRLAVVTSLVSKCGTLVLRVVSIPIAIRLLGMDLFGIYAAITMIVGLLDLMHVGIGPALTKEISRAVTAGDRKRERDVFITSILLSGGLTLLATLVFAALLFFVPIPVLFGEKFAPHADVMTRAAWIGLLAFSLYFAVHIWRHVNQVLVLGIGQVKSVAAMILLEGSLTLAAGSAVLFVTGRLALVYFTMAAVVIGVTGWGLPRLFRARIGWPPQDEESLDGKAPNSAGSGEMNRTCAPVAG